MRSRSILDKFLTLLLVFTMVAVYAASAATAESFAYAASGEIAWYDSIPEMLAAGKYEEGVVVAGIDMSKAKKSRDPGSALDSRKLRAGTEEIISIDSGDDSSQQEPKSRFEQFKENMSGQNGGICITSIRRSGMTTEQILRLLASDDSIVFAEPNYITGIDSEENDVNTDDTAPAPEAAAQDSGEPAAGADNAPAETGEPSADSAPAEAGEPAAEIIKPEEETAVEGFPAAMAGGSTSGDASELQWSSKENASLHAAGDNGDVSIKVPDWPDGSNMEHEIIVAVMDIPADFKNPDLADSAYAFSAELREKLGCDEHGFNALWDAKGKELEYYEGAEHGSHVAGIIGASWNGKGISGVGSKVKIVSVQNSREGYTNLIDTLRGYNFVKEAVIAGVEIRVINNSWGLEQSSKALDAAVTELGENGVVSIFAAGNSAQDLNVTADINALLANNPYAIIVASTDPAGKLADSSCYGKGIVTLGAPGACILSCLPVSSAKYIPALTENKLYEDFEDGDASVKVCQIGYSTVNGEFMTEYVPDPDKPISGTEGVVVSTSEEMGFEGEKALKIRIDRSELSGESENNLALKIELGNVSGSGVTGGDVFGFAYGSEAELEPIKIMDTASGSMPEYVLFEKNNRNCWNTFSYTLEKNIDTGNLTLIMELIARDAEVIYLDAFGAADESQKQPYGFKSGTSMACPAVSGSAAVIASRHYSELEEIRNKESKAAYAKTLANLVRSSVRPLESLKDTTSTGGIIDLTVKTSIIGSNDESGPDITDLTVDGNKVTLTGTGFGNTQGTAAVRKYMIGAFPVVNASVTSWSDSEAVLSLEKDFEGIIEAVLTSSNGKHDTFVKYINKSSNIFEKDHRLDSETGGPFEFDEENAMKLGDYETSGLFVAGDDRLYYMPQMAKNENNPAYNSLYCFDPDRNLWTECPPYPLWIRRISGAWLDGTLYIKGTAVDTSVNADNNETVPYYEQEDDFEAGTPYIYSYTPGESSWKKCSLEGVADEYTLFTGGNRLMLAGVSEEEFYDSDLDTCTYPSVRDYDPAAGAGGNIWYSASSQKNPIVAYAGGNIYIFDFLIGNDLYVIDESMKSGEEDKIELPEFYFGAEDRLGEDEKILDPYGFSMLSYGDTLILTGPAAKDGSSDTFMLKAGEKSFKPFSRRASDAGVLMPAASALDGRLYVIGASDFEPEKRIFRSTALPDAEEFKITYDPNGGNFGGSTDNITGEYAKGTVIFIHDAPEREGYTFKYWKGSEYKPGDRYTVTEDHTFVAQWEENDDSPGSGDDQSGSGDGENGSGSSGGRVNTGDESHIGLWMTLAVLAALELAVMMIIRRRKA